LEHSQGINELQLMESDPTLLYKPSDLSDYLFSHDTALSNPIREGPDLNLGSGKAATPPQVFKKIDFKYHLRMAHSSFTPFGVRKKW